MTLLLISVIWVLASAAVAMMPVHRQIIPGVALMAAGPVLVVTIALQVGVMGGVFAVWAYFSMYHRPLVTIWNGLRAAKSNEITE